MEDHQQPIDASEDLSLFCCQNRKCIAFGSRGAGNLVVRDRIGKQKQTRLLYATICKKRFVETKGAVFYGAQKPRQKLLSSLQHVQEGNGMRQAARLEQIKEDTVIRCAKLAGK